MPKAVVTLRGGLNTSTDRSAVKPGQMTRCMNFEITSSGVVRRAQGYRRWSGGCWYGPPSFFMWGPFDDALTQGSAVVGQWGLPGGVYLRNETSTWVDYGRLAPYTGRGRLTYHYDFFDKTDNWDPYSQDLLPTTSAQVVVGLQGREPIRPERLQTPDFTVNNHVINQTFGIDATWPLLSAGQDTDTAATAAHEIIDRAWPAYWSQDRGQGITVSDTPDPDGVGSIPGYHPYGGIAGLTYWRDRLYVVADILSFTFDSGTSRPEVGDVVELLYDDVVSEVTTQTQWRWYVERVIVSSGSWDDGDAAGTILLVGGVPGYPTNAYPPILSTPEWSTANGRLLDDGTDVLSNAPGAPYLNNITQGSTSIVLLQGYADPIEEGAALWRSIDLYDVPSPLAWERVDLGYEIAFKDGDNAFLVVNRIASDNYLDGGVGNPAIEVTDWTTAGTGLLGTTPVSVAAVAEDDTSYALLSSGSASPPPNVLSSQPLLLTGFDLNVPEYSIITGIEVEIIAFDFGSITSAWGPLFFEVSLQIGETRYGNKAPAGIIGSSPTTYTLGSQSDLWGAPITPASANDSTFGVQISIANGSVNIDRVRLRVHYKPYVSTVYFKSLSDGSKEVLLTAYSVCRYLPPGAKPSIGSSITIAGATPSGYNGSRTVIEKPVFVTDDALDQFAYFIVSGMPPLGATVTGSVTVNAVAINENLMTRVGVQVNVTISNIITEHGYSTGQWVTISNVVQAQYNGNFKIYVLDNDTFVYYPYTEPSANPTDDGITPLEAIRTAVAEASAVWYYKEKGDWETNDASGILTVYDLNIPTEVGSGLQIRSDPAGAGTLYALTASAASRVYMPSSKDLVRNEARYEWLIANFTRSVVFEQLLGVSGCGPAFSFDGKYFIRIRTGLSKALDRPRHLAEHNFQLALGYSFGDVAFSDLGYAESFSAVFDGSSPASLNPDFAGGSTTVSLADPVYGMLRLPEQSMAVFCDNSIRRISGAGGVFTEQTVRAGHGIIEYTARNVNGMVVFTDSLGVMRLRPTDLFGQLLPQYVSAPVAEIVSESEASSLSGPRPKPLFAMPFNNKNQYRLYFNDGSYLAMTMVGSEMEPQFWIGQYDFVPFCVGIGVHSDNTQVQFAGHVYTANYLLPFGPGPGGQPSLSDTEGDGSGIAGMSVNPAWPFQLDVTSTWDTDAMPALATFFMGDMAEDGGLHATKRFGNIGLDVRAYGYASMAIVFSTQLGNVVARRVRSTDFVAAADGRPFSVGTAVGGDYLTVQQFRSSIGSNCSGEWLLMTVESNGSRDYDAGQDDAGIRWLRPFELGIAAVYFDLNKSVSGSETTD
jgi:hypothetical protein